ncbi:MAG TPA: hypothetical protein VK661_01920 [Planctomycetota bacterium]|jgi:hypothetical protein|nr:hypothetical protein [Planctomycetota bacterium]
MRTFAWIAAAALAGCGYSAGGLIEHESVFLPTFDNLDERRTFEFDLTRAVGRELAARGVRVNAPDAPIELRGKILKITEPTLVENPGDVPIVGSVSFKIEVALVSRSTGRELSKKEREETASFSSGRFETRETARQEVIKKLASWVVTLVEKDW